MPSSSLNPLAPSPRGAPLPPALTLEPDADAAREVSCSHCGLPVPPARIALGKQTQFCCEACNAVFEAISGSGFGEYYAFRRSSGESGKRAQSTGKSYAEFDDPAFQELYTRARGDGLVQVELYVEGVHCSACVWLVERVPKILPGLSEARLDAGRSIVELSYDPARTTLSEVARTLEKLGYRPHPPQGARDREQRRREDRALLGRIAVAGAVAGNVMLIAFALYGGAFSGIEREYEAFFRWGSFIIATPAVLWCAGLFFRGAVAAVRTRTPHMDIPITIGVLAGYLWGAYNTVTAKGDIYFDTVTTLIFLLLVGRFIQRRQQHRARDAAELLYSLAPAHARLVDGELVRDVPIISLSAGSVIEVLAGERIPVDGTVSAGRSTVDASLLTGESRPEEVDVGGAVHAGCVNLVAPLRIRVEQTGQSTRIGQLLRQVEEAAQRRAPVVRLADRLSGTFVVVVLGLALATLGLWLWLDPSRAIDHVVALLVVTCPCALGMATPLTVNVALGRAARSGILAKGGDALELISTPGLIVFDKTGTLTQGRMELVAWHGDRSLQALVRAAESRSAHPIARAIERATADLPSAEVQSFEHALGGGIRARVNGAELVIGSPTFVAQSALVPEWASIRAGEEARAGRSPVLVACEGEVRAVLAFGDPVRPEALAALQRLQKLGYRVAILSGDHPEVVAALVRELPVQFEFARGGATPEEKLTTIETLAKSSRVVMVGDGVNDAAALSAASVGIAVHGGAEASLAAADVFITRQGLTPIVDLVCGARRTVNVIKLGLAFSLLYNAVGVGLALVGQLTPLAAAVLMPLSSLTVLTTAFKSRTFVAPESDP